MPPPSAGFNAASLLDSVETGGVRALSASRAGATLRPEPAPLVQKREPDPAVAFQASLLAGLRAINNICTRFSQKDLQGLLTATSIVGAILGKLTIARARI